MKKILSFVSFVFLGLFTLAFPLNQVSATFFSISGEYLYWTAQQKRMEFISTGQDAKADKTHGPRYQWNSGYRVGIEFGVLQIIFLKPGLEYTHFETHGNSKVHALSNVRGISQTLPSFLPTLSSSRDNSNGIATIRDGESRISLIVDHLDLNLFGGGGCIGCFYWDWGFGLRGTILKSDWHTDYVVQFSGEENELDTVFEPENTRINWKYYAGGVKLNVEFVCEIGCDFKLYQEFTGALLLGQLKRHTNADITQSDIDAVDNFDFERSRFKAVPVLNSETGLAWSICCGTGLVLQAKAAFEYSKWFQVGEKTFNSIPFGARFKDTCTDLDLYGLTAGLTLEF